MDETRRWYKSAMHSLSWAWCSASIRHISVSCVIWSRRAELSAVIPTASWLNPPRSLAWCWSSRVWAAASHSVVARKCCWMISSRRWFWDWCRLACGRKFYDWGEPDGLGEHGCLVAKISIHAAESYGREGYILGREVLLVTSLTWRCILKLCDICQSLPLDKTFHGGCA